MFIATILGLLALAGGLAYRFRLRRLTQARGRMLSDDMVRQIEEQGYIDVDEPLDFEEIHEQEERFWEEEAWEEPDEY